MVTLINDARLAAGARPLGFLNPRLYALMANATARAECFADVGIDQVGELWDCDTFTTCEGCIGDGVGGRGFVATKGWDTQTGWGQPKFAGLLEHLSKD